MKCLVKGCKTRSLLMTVELCYPCSQLVEQGNDFKPDWDTVKPYLDRIAELEAEVEQLKSIPHIAFALEPDSVRVGREIQNAVIKSIEKEREACANLAEQMVSLRVAKAIRKRSLTNEHTN